MDKYGGDYDVILVDWHNLAWFLQVMQKKVFAKTVLR